MAVHWYLVTAYPAILEHQLHAWSKSHRRVWIMTLPHTTRYFNRVFYYYKYNSVELIFEETKLNEISKNKFPSKITYYTVYKTSKIIMDKKVIKSMKIWSPQNEQTYLTVQTITDNTIKHKTPYNWPAFLAVNDKPCNK